MLASAQTICRSEGQAYESCCVDWALKTVSTVWRPNSSFPRIFWRLFVKQKVIFEFNAIISAWFAFTWRWILFSGTFLPFGTEMSALCLCHKYTLKADILFTLTDSGLSEDESCLGSYLHQVLTKFWASGLEVCSDVLRCGYQGERSILCMEGCGFGEVRMELLIREVFNVTSKNVKNLIITETMLRMRVPHGWLGHEDSSFMSGPC